MIESYWKKVDKVNDWTNNGIMEKCILLFLLSCEYRRRANLSIMFLSCEPRCRAIWGVVRNTVSCEIQILAVVRNTASCESCEKTRPLFLLVKNQSSLTGQAQSCLIGLYLPWVLGNGEHWATVGHHRWPWQWHGTLIDRGITVVRIYFFFLCYCFCLFVFRADTPFMYSYLEHAHSGVTHYLT